jgi:RNA polymerase sigma-70 factor (ECF subfamily)
MFREPPSAALKMSTDDARILDTPAAIPQTAEGESSAAGGTSTSWSDLLKLKLNSDEELAAKLQRGNTEALTVLFERYSSLVFRHARRVLKSDTEAEDIVQQVFLDLLRSAQRFDNRRGSFKTWLLMFSYCQTVNRWRQLQSRHYYDSPSLEDIVPEIFKGVQQPSGLHTAEAICLVEQALSLIQPRQRITIELIYYEGLTPEEVAQRTGESVTVVHHNLYRGLDKMRTVLGESRNGPRAFRIRKWGRLSHE